ncbi:nuclear transport factor 2 family protein [Changpingibacter yushuensis]|uniref:nuclear transport factor 2 family protein n=1 Tax=Changpingibacter yushuensis TaxID=2758440 RepID=UPI00165D47D9|nr:nuclear transport factor 2 family protein [Changpingibacter yushuensis]
MPTSSDLTPSRARLEQTVTDYQSALNARDPERIAALFAPDATRADPYGTPPVIGRSAIRAAWEEIFTNLGSIAFTAHAAHGARDTIAFEFTSVTTTSNGVGSVLKGINVVTVNSQGLITSLVAYYDDADSRPADLQPAR